MEHAGLQLKLGDPDMIGSCNTLRKTSRWKVDPCPFPPPQKAKPGQTTSTHVRGFKDC